MPRDILLVEEYPHSPEQVWALLSDAAQIARWLMPNDFVPEVGRHFTFRTTPRPGFDGVIHCQVLDIDPPRLMRWAWQAGSIDSTVTFEVSPTASGARLTLRHAGFRGVASLLPWLIFRQGWNKKLRAGIARLLAA